ncbi:MAG TPA: Asp-tRNA(Asn)/Glu-tRNA(Gln) amidotransferase subunit GatC [Vicinamibacteria bacterium]|nr:Asp-tRNA(Asn)/Glu-tRNA(Gln) amidotransferase subunit GatC [Vicinamibacteria bacterium]
MPKATVETVDHVARLAHLSLRDEERQVFARQLDEILAFAESIQKLDTTLVPPMSHASAREAFREDAVLESLPRESVTTSAPDAQDGLFRVPRIL